MPAALRPQAFDAASQTYTVHMDNGSIERGIPRAAIVVPFDLKAIINPGMGIGIAN